MKETTLVEYGVEVAADLMVTPPDAEHLDLEPGHPGMTDPAYVAAVTSSSSSVVAIASSGCHPR